MAIVTPPPRQKQTLSECGYQMINRLAHSPLSTCTLSTLQRFTPDTYLLCRSYHTKSIIAQEVPTCDSLHRPLGVHSQFSCEAAETAVYTNFAYYVCKGYGRKAVDTCAIQRKQRCPGCL